ncbi:MAG: AbrB/MazE/SpoVT family DNA-binding domain-containing protein [Actinomycetota bacterium]|nr:AbrB/MazE/SpoVT family DNA-binding domain-containing protein [Actinomycetota bacterium]MDQ3600122.1 AbrB/MazE/SpoVT family DNA-binding domain-containing protein [Actinomycetota bacterium]
MRITSKGQITIPQQVREELNLHPGDEIDVVVDGDGAKIVRAAGSPTRGRRVVARLRGTATAQLDMSTDELMALLRDD